MQYLALGDSYTIGELVAYEQNFPSQTAALLQEQGLDVNLNELIAVTGWTTDELAAGIYAKQPQAHYDWVSLLIGVNNQYRGRSVDEYAVQFYQLLCQAIFFAKNKAQHVVVLSIPDWGLTPFNKDRNKQLVSAEIDAYNAINKKISLSMGVHYLDITPSTRAHAEDSDYLAEDLLHYSAKEYTVWAKAVADIIRNQTQIESAL